MQRFNVRLSSVNDVKNFAKAATVQPYKIDLISGKYSVSAKSLMGIFSLDLLKPIEVELDCTDGECMPFKEMIGEYIVEGK